MNLSCPNSIGNERFYGLMDTLLVVLDKYLKV